MPRPGRPDLTGVRCDILCPSFKQAIDIHGKLMIQELEGPWAFLGGKLNRSRWSVEFPGGSIIRFWGAENIGGSLGIRSDIVAVDEADDIDPGEFDRVVVPWLSEPWSLKIVMAPGTPRRGRYGLLWKLYKLGQDGAPGFHSLKASYKDAPEQVSEEYVDRVRATMAPATFECEWLVNFDSGEGLVYAFDPKKHVKVANDETPWTEILVGVDWGYEGPGVFLVAGVQGSGRDAVVHLLDEVYETRRVPSWWIEKARELGRKYPSSRWYADPSQPAMIESLRREAGVRIRKADNAIEDGIACVADKLAIRFRTDGSEYSRLFVDPKCKNTIREFGLYRRKRDPKNKDVVLEDVVDKDDHTMDALKYLCFSRFGKASAQRIEHGDASYRYD